MPKFYEVQHTFEAAQRIYKRREVLRESDFSAWGEDWRKQLDDHIGAGVVLETTDAEAIARAGQPIDSGSSTSSAEANGLLAAFRARAVPAEAGEPISGTIGAPTAEKPKSEEIDPRTAPAVTRGGARSTSDAAAVPTGPASSSGPGTGD